MSVLQKLIAELEQDLSLDEPDRLRQRCEALDRLELYLLAGQAPAFDTKFIEAKLYQRAAAMCATLEAVNQELYQSIRNDIQRGIGPERFLQCLHESGNDEHGNGDGYDYADELLSGVLQLEKPEDDAIPAEAEMVLYQPTPARHIFDLIARAALTEDDVLIDLGSGLGHVPLLASICSPARCIGIEFEAAYIDCARKCARGLNLKNVTFLQQDARAADLSNGTVFYLYTPFTGTILRAVLDALQSEATRREIRICTFGPCTPIIAEEPWLETLGTLDTGRIALFRHCK
jgi:hypothetical protein